MDRLYPEALSAATEQGTCSLCLPDKLRPSFLQAAEAEAAAGAALKAEPQNEEPAADEDSVGEVAALMAAEWCSVLGGAYASAESVEYGMAGLAAAIILATSSRCRPLALM